MKHSLVRVHDSNLKLNNTTNLKNNYSIYDTNRKVLVQLNILSFGICT